MTPCDYSESAGRTCHNTVGHLPLPRRGSAPDYVWRVDPTTPGRTRSGTLDRGNHLD